MRIIIIFLIVVFIIAILSNLGQFLANGKINFQGEQTSEKQILSESSGLAAIAEQGNLISLIKTYITKGPEEGEAIEGNAVTFEFEAKTPSGEDKEGVSFETKVEGLENDWKRTSSQKRTVYLPPGPEKYTFLVRAVSNPTVSTPAKRTFKVNTSPYFGKVKISNVRTPNSSYPSVITLKTNFQKGEEINITGWEVKGKRGETTIPQGLKKAFPDLSPTKDIIIKKGDVIYLSSGRGPLGRERGYRLNNCLGYLRRSSNYSLPLPKSCPRPREEDVSHLNPCCREFILRIRGCEVPDYSRNFRIYQDSECMSYLGRNFNYNGCLMNYSHDENFLRNTWHIFLRSDVATGDFCDTIYLRDQNGFLVDEYSYGKDICR